MVQCSLIPQTLIVESLRYLISVWCMIQNRLGCLLKILGWLWAGVCGPYLRNLCNGLEPPGLYQQIPEQLDSNSYFQDVLEMQADVFHIGGCSGVEKFYNQQYHGWWSRNISSLWSVQSLAHLAAFSLKYLFLSKTKLLTTWNLGHQPSLTSETSGPTRLS